MSLAEFAHTQCCAVQISIKHTQYYMEQTDDECCYFLQAFKTSNNGMLYVLYFLMLCAVIFKTLTFSFKNVQTADWIM